jgi:lipoate-protein ligase A
MADSKSSSLQVLGLVSAFRNRLKVRPWILQVDAAASATANMATEIVLLHAASREEIGPTLRFYSWDPPAVSLGRFQRTDGINLAALERRGWDLVRRPTGGRAVLHQHEVTYSIVLPPSVVENAGVRTSHAVLTKLLNDGLRRLLPDSSAERIVPPARDERANRTPNCFATAAECDVVTEAGKLVGSAQARHGGALLQHGSILLDADREAWGELFGEPGRLVTLWELCGREVTADEVHGALISAFEAAGLTFLDSAHSALGQSLR